MKRLQNMTTAVFALGLFSAVCLGMVAPAQADTVTDTLFLELTGKEWCRGDAKFFDTVKVKKADLVTLTLTHDTGSEDIQATINTNGDNATVDAILLAGKALLANKSGATAELVLTGTEPSHPDHFLTLRGKATLDKNTNHVTKVTGTIVYQIVSDLEGVPTDCFGNGTFGTQKIIGGTLMVANAPDSVGGKFVSDPKFTSVHESSKNAVLAWAEATGANFHTEAIAVGFNLTTNQVSGILFSSADSLTVVDDMWECVDLFSPCVGAMVDRVAGKITFSKVALNAKLGANPPITLNGTLTFTPF